MFVASIAVFRTVPCFNLPFLYSGLLNNSQSACELIIITEKGSWLKCFKAIDSSSFKTA